jgi:hypothetical protein
VRHVPAAIRDNNPGKDHTPMRKKVAVAMSGLATVLALAGTASAASAAPAADQREQRVATAGEWRYSHFYSVKLLCEIQRTVYSASYPTDGCYREPSAGWYFWYLVE